MVLICFHLSLWALTAAILSETVVTGLRKWRVCDCRSPMYALMLAHLERRRVWLSHVTCTLPPNDTFSLSLLKQVLSSIFRNSTENQVRVSTLYIFRTAALGNDRIFKKMNRDDATKEMFSGWQLATEDSLMVAYILS